MKNVTLARSYLEKASVRLKVLDLLVSEKAYSDVVREAQEAVELALKGILRHIGVEPPKQHDVGRLIIEYAAKLPAQVESSAGRLAEISKWLRKEREFAFYGAVDFVPSEEYTLEDANRARQDAVFVVQAARRVIDG